MTLASELIKRSYYLAQVLDPREEIEGFQASEGLYQLNRIIDLWGNLSQYIPSYKILTQAVVAGTYTYTITPVLAQLSESHILDQNNVQFTLTQIDLQRFNTLNFALSLTAPARPYYIFLQNDFANFPTSSKIQLYPVPDQPYTLTMYAMQRLANVQYSDDLTTVPAYWQAALEYELGKKLISIYSTTPSQTFYDDYNTVMRQLKSINRRDRRVQIQNEFSERRRYRPWGVYVG